MEEISGGEAPTILCGDFNLPPDSDPIGLIRGQLKDAFEVSQLPPYGSIGTFHGFSYDRSPGRRIDYVFVDSTVQVLRYAALSDQWDGSYPSDHLPVLVELSWE